MHVLRGSYSAVTIVRLNCIRTLSYQYLPVHLCLLMFFTYNFLEGGSEKPRTGALYIDGNQNTSCSWKIH